MDRFSSIPQLPITTELDEPPSHGEVVNSIKQQQNKHAVGMDFIPGELLKFGGDVLHSTIGNSLIYCGKKMKFRTLLKYHA